MQAWLALELEGQNMKNKIKTKYFFLIVGLMVVSLLLYFTSGSEREILTDTTLPLEAPDSGNKKYTFDTMIDGVEIGSTDISVPEREYSQKELIKLSDEVAERAVDKLLNGNPDLTNVTDDLCFFEKMDGYPFEFSFSSDSPECISDEGEILLATPFDAGITIFYAYGDVAESFKVKVNVNPGSEVRARVYRNAIQAKLDETVNVTEETASLPTEVDGNTVSYAYPAVKRNSFYLLLGPVASVLIIIGSKRDEKKALAKEKEEILSEYPVLLQKMALYQATGMTIRNIWAAIYEEGIIKKSEKNPMYREMGITLNELKSGVSEGMAYKRFGERTQVSELIRFTALLSQNLRKGSSKLKELLDAESVNAFSQRKLRAIKLSEEAGTKLLFPMMILLMEVMVLIMVPAFVNI